MKFEEGDFVECVSSGQQGVVRSVPNGFTVWVHFGGEPTHEEVGVSVNDLKSITFGDFRKPNETKSRLSVNPKDKLGIKKVQLDLVPATSTIFQAYAMEDGALKYGPYNWRESTVSAKIYVAAARRHLDLWYNREENTFDTNVPNLGAVLACIGIIVDAMVAGTLVDDRPKALDAAKLNDLLLRKGIGCNKS